MTSSMVCPMCGLSLVRDRLQVISCPECSVREKQIVFRRVVETRMTEIQPRYGWDYLDVPSAVRREPVRRAR